MKAGRAFPPTALAVTIVSIVGVSIALAAGELVPDSLPPVSPIILPKTPETTGASPTTDPTPISVGLSAASSNTTPVGTTPLAPPSTTNASVAAPPSVPISPTAPNSEPIPQPPQSTTVVYVVPPSAPVPTSKPAQADAGSDNDDGEDDSSEDDDEPDESED